MGNRVNHVLNVAIIALLDEIDCGDLDDPSNGDVMLTDGNTQYGAVAVYTCNNGYIVANGDETRTCEASEEWSGSEPNCMYVNCGNPGTISNGNKDGDIYHYGATVSYSCDTGYYINGSQTLQCQANGQWNGSAPSCDIVTCTVPQIDHGSITGSNTYNSIVTVVCDQGYKINGSDVIVCQDDGHWNDSTPSCDPVMCDPLMAPNGGVKDGNSYTFGSKVSFTCNSGYVINGSNVLSCEANGEWNGTAPTCIAQCLEELSSPEHGSKTPDTNGMFLVGDTVMFSCDNPYIINGSPVVICEEDGEWNTTAPTCEEHICPDPGTPDNGSQNGNYTLGSNVTFSCNAGYNLIGNNWLECDLEGWRGSNSLDSDIPICDPVNCSNPGTPMNGQKIGLFYTYQSVVIFECDEGWALEGNEAIVCEANGAWNGSIPTCVLISCEDPGTPSNAMRIGSSLIVGSILMFTCDVGYSLNGEGIIQCTDAGTWNSSIPSCDIITCTNLGTTIPNGKIEGASNTYQSTKTFICQIGYELQGASAITCQADGMWSGSVPSCSIVHCSRPDDPQNGQAVVDNITTYQSTVTYVCNPGYKLNSTSTILIATCQANKTWTVDTPHCFKICDSLVLSENVLQDPLSSANVFIEGDSVTLSCVDGYTLDGVAVVTCSSSGQWSHVLPECLGKQHTFGIVIIINRSRNICCWKE